MTSAVPSALTRSSSAAICSPVASIQLAGRLVGEQQPRPVGERARDRHSLHLAARQLRGPVIGPCGEPDVVEQLAPSALRRCAVGDAGLGLGQLDVLRRRQHRQQEEALEDEADRP